MTTTSDTSPRNPSDTVRAAAAVDAVLALHVPFERPERQFCAAHDSPVRAQFWSSRWRAVSRCRDCREVTRQACAACGSPCADVAWPCPTVLAVRQALGAGEGTR